MEEKNNPISATRARIFNGQDVKPAAVKPAAPKPVATKLATVQPAQPVAPKAEAPKEAPKTEAPKVEAPKPVAAPKPVKPAKKGKVSKQQIALILSIVAVIVAIVVAIVAIALANNKPAEPEEIDPNAIVKPLTEEEKKITQQTIDEYIDIEVEGYKEENGRKAVVINITNSGENRTCLAIDIVAKDESGEIIDKTTLYAEGIEPAQTQRFFAFELSQLKPEQLASAKYEIYKARTYEVNRTQTETE